MRAPHLIEALAPILLLVALLGLAVALFGADASYGPNQISLLAAAGLAAWMGMRGGLGWSAMQEAMVHGVSLAMGAIFILLVVGAVIGSWILSGTVPTLIYYGLMLLHPAVFYPATCLICALVGLAIGSSWTVAGTIGIALMGVAAGLGLDPAIAAGAVISGAYFGDKMSPLSETTNLAPAIAGSELFSHIRHMAWTTVPTFGIALLLFSLMAWKVVGDTATEAEVPALLEAIETQYRIGWYLLLPLLLVLALSLWRVPALLSLGAGAVAGVVFALLFQPARVLALGGAEHGPVAGMIAGAWTSLFAGMSVDSGYAPLDELLNRGGMASMLNTVWLIICAMAFGAAMERAGLLQRMIVGLLRQVRSAGRLVAVTVLTAIGVNLITSDQYISIVLTGRVYRLEYERQGLDPLNLSRAVEDGGTITSALVPWNTCGAYMAATLGVSTFSYLPYAFFNWIGPLLAMAMAIAGFKVLRRSVAASAAA
jgi:NhaC family Na+:H+ antiporter